MKSIDGIKIIQVDGLNVAALRVMQTRVMWGAETWRTSIISRSLLPHTGTAD